MNDRRRPRSAVSFNEGWVFVPRELDPCAPVPDGQPVTLPHTWNASDGQDGGGDYRRGASSYVKEFARPDHDGEVWLEFAGANSATQVWLNGVAVGRHRGGYSTFRVELTAALADANVLVVTVDNGPDEISYPQRADFTFYGGLYRDVSLLLVGREHLALDEHGGPGLTVTPTLEGDRASVALAASVTGGDAVRFAIGGEDWRTVPVADGAAATVLDIARVRRWHGTADPHLYTATAELLRDGEVVDAVEVRFGCRTFAVDPARGFLLNGEPYPLRGVSRHQDWLGVGNAITPAMMDADLALLTELGATTVRLAHYQHDQRFYDLCDEAGIVVWAEIPMITEFLPGAVDDAAHQLTELIVQNRHHASIVCWGLSNEISVAGTGPESVEAHRGLNDLAHRLDPTRLTTMAHLFMLESDDPLVTVADVMSYNLYYGWYVGEVEDNDAWFDDFHARFPDVAVGLSEYGADANVALQTANPTRGDYSEQYQARYHEHMAAMIEARPWLWATHVWNLADFAADGRDEGGVPGRNMKGLVTFDRSVKKDAFYVYKAAWSSEPFVHLAGRRYVDRAEDVTEVTVYSNQPVVELWRDGVRLGRREGRRVFRFDVSLSGEHTLVARAGEASDTMTVRRVAEPNPDYTLVSGPVINWFDDDVLPSPEGFFSIRDTLRDIRRTPEGAALIDQMMAAAAASRGDVAKKIKIPAVMQKMIERMSVESLLKQAGGAVGAEQVAALNAALNRIAK